jgi:hypothetical protein
MSEFDLVRELTAGPLPPLQDADRLAAIAAVTEALEQLRKASASLEQLRYELEQQSGRRRAASPRSDVGSEQVDGGEHDREDSDDQR